MVIGTQQIGETAGMVWSVLKAEGPMSLAQLAKKVEAPRDIVMQGVGWLAREEKVAIQEVKGKRLVSII